jgi:hypothetical protein
MIQIRESKQIIAKKQEIMEPQIGISKQNLQKTLIFYLPFWQMK